MTIIFGSIHNIVTLGVVIAYFIVYHPKLPNLKSVGTKIRYFKDMIYFQTTNT